jgi:hypothetical protein
VPLFAVLFQAVLSNAAADGKRLRVQARSPQKGREGPVTAE